MKSYRPTSAGVRFKTTPDFSEVTKSKPEKSLLANLTLGDGRNALGHITSRFRGGGHKRRYRIVDFKRDKLDVPAKVAGIEYDPNRSAHIALLHYADGEKRYIISPTGLKVGRSVVSSNKLVEIESGNAMPLREIPVGTNVYNIEIKPGAGGKISRSAGTFSQLMAKEADYSLFKFPSY